MILYNREVIEKAKRIAFNAGYNPDQLVVRVNKDIHYDFLIMDCAPVIIEEIMPVYMMFYDDARKQLCNEWIAAQGPAAVSISAQSEWGYARNRGLSHRYQKVDSCRVPAP